MALKAMRDELPSAAVLPVSQREIGFRYERYTVHL